MIDSAEAVETQPIRRHSERIRVFLNPKGEWYVEATHPFKESTVKHFFIASVHDYTEALEETAHRKARQQIRRWRHSYKQKMKE